MKNTNRWNSFTENLMAIINTGIVYTVSIMIVIVITFVVYLNPKNKPIRFK